MNGISFQGGLPDHGPGEPVSKINPSKPLTGGDSRETEKAKLRETCAEFESLFLQYMLKGMRATIPLEEEGGMGQSKEMYNAMADEQLARELALHAGGIGLADVLLRQLSQNEGEKDIP